MEPEVELEPAVQPEPAPMIAETEPVLTAFDEPVPEPEAASEPEPELEPAAAAEPEPELEPAAAAQPEPAAEPEPAPQPVVAEVAELEPEPAPEPVEVGPTAEHANKAAPDVHSTLVAWPSTAPAAGPGNGAPAQAGSFEEATSVIPVWQQTDPNADPKRTVSLQAMPPEEVASGSGYAALLTFESGPFAGRIVALPNQMVSIGRAPDNDVVVGDPATSGHHGRIEVRAGSFWISDLGSTNGTLVNGEPVIEKQLSDNDMIAIGQNTLRFTLEA
jgi:hypothetical protein